jgi:hypothetical protein
MDFMTTYAHPSSVLTRRVGVLVFLAAALEQLRSPTIVSASLAEPVAFARALTALHEVVAARYYRPDLWRYLDPVVTADGEHVRLECFSSCASVYARVDLTHSAFAEAQWSRPGTTNVDFGQEFLRNLARLRPRSRADFELGEQCVTLRTETATTIERKVKLPQRWVKGFLQVQAIARRAQPELSIDGQTARMLLAKVPARPCKELHLVPRKGRPQLLQRRPAGGGSVAVPGAHRLRLLAKLVPDLQRLDIYRHEDALGCSLIAHLPVGRMTFQLSSSVERGFSGEGETLLSFGAVDERAEDAHALIAVAHQLPATTLATQLAISPDEALALTDQLAAEGVLGYDRHHDRFFHRVLPFAGNALKSIAPRIAGMQELLAGGAVEIESIERAPQLSVRGWVRSGDSEYRVTLTVNEAGVLAEGDCTCRWIRSHGLSRGPCKHLLALRVAAARS